MPSYKLSEDFLSHPLLRVWDIPRHNRDAQGIFEGFVHEVGHWAVVLRSVPCIENGVLSGMTDKMCVMVNKHEDRDRYEVLTSALTYLVLRSVQGKSRHQVRSFIVDMMLASLEHFTEDEAITLFNTALRRKSLHALASGLLEVLEHHGMLEVVDAQV